MMIKGDFIDPQYKVNSLTDGRSRLPEQLVIVPIRVVRHLTKASGFLYINSNERKQYMDFDPGQYFVPKIDWIPPYPYCSADVLFPIEYQNVDTQIVFESDGFPFGAILEEQSLKEDLIVNDSPGG